jgi:hypothetical protein
LDGECVGSKGREKFFNRTVIHRRGLVLPGADVFLRNMWTWVNLCTSATSRNAVPRDMDAGQLD